MYPRPERPLGVTLLALTHFWSASGAVFFPLMFLMMSLAGVLRNLAGQFPSRALGFVVICLIALLWWGLYIFLGFLGYGLWTLRPWGRKASIALQWVGIATSIVILIVMAVVMHTAWVGLIAIPVSAFYGFILWYLQWPNVRRAFGETVVLENRPPSQLVSRMLKIPLWARIIGGLGLCLAMFVCLLVFGVESMMRSSDAYPMALQQAQESPCVVAQLGTPLQSNGLISGSIETSNNDGKASLSIPVRGPKGKADLNVMAKKTEGKWAIKSMLLERDQDEFVIIPARADGKCQ
ncbi:MAG TPA: cytochrome c oxidase assembly factor Coa1 family protein [Acidobacteriaceae bacterium]|jgi:hypothetical protein